MSPVRSNISFVMPCLNDVAYVEEAVRSVLDQPEALEVIVQDPGSTDGSRPLLEELKQQYGDRLVLEFEPDDGQSDALNRGFDKARGQIFGWLNSDDRLRPESLQVVDRLLGRPSKARSDNRSGQGKWLYGRAGIIDQAGQQRDSLIATYKSWRGARFSRAKLLTENFICQMAVFFDRDLWFRAGGLDNNLHLDMDYDLWLRFSRDSAPIVVQDVLADFRVHAEAKGSLQTAAQLDAAYETAARYAPELGARGRLSLLLHRAYSTRTRLAYRFLKP